MAVKSCRTVDSIFSHIATKNKCYNRASCSEIKFLEKKQLITNCKLCTFKLRLLGTNQLGDQKNQGVC